MPICPGTRRLFSSSQSSTDTWTGTNAYVSPPVALPGGEAHVLDYDRQNRRGPGCNVGVAASNLLEAFPGLTPPITKAVLADQLGPIRGRVRVGCRASISPRLAPALWALRPPSRPSERPRCWRSSGGSSGKAGPASVVFACRYAVKVKQRPPGARVLLISGCDDIDGIAPSVSRLVKPYRQADLAAKLDELGSARRIDQILRSGDLSLSARPQRQQLYPSGR